MSVSRDSRRPATLMVLLAVAALAWSSLAPYARAQSPAPSGAASPASGGASAATPAPGAAHSVLRIGYTQEFSDTAINPFLVFLGIDYELLALNYDLLVEFGPKDYSPVPGLAESWGQSPDGLTWTYHIRTGAIWQDGQPVTADDVAFTYTYVIESHDPKYKGPWAPGGNDLNSPGTADNPLTYFDSYLDLDGGFENTRIQSVTAPDPQTVVIKVKSPLTTLNQLYVPIVPKHIWNSITFKDAAAKALFDVTKSVGSGPYQVVEFKPKELIRLKANPSYWGGAPQVDELVYQFYGSVDAAIQALKSGEVDVLEDVPTSQFQALSGDPTIATLAAKSADFIELGFQSWDPTKAQFTATGCTDASTCKIGPTTGSNGNPWLTRPDVRRALMSVIDKKELVDKVLQGYGDPGASLVNPGLNPYGYTPPAGDPLVYPSYDPNDDAAKAAVRKQRSDAVRAALGALGFKDTDGNGILNVPSDPTSRAFDPKGAGKDFRLRLYVRDTRPADQLAADLIKQWLEAAGVGVDKQVVKEDFLTTATIPSSSNADSDLYLWGWGPDPDPNFILGAMTTNAIGNWQDANWSNTTYDKLVEQQRGVVDVATRKRLIAQALQLFYEQGPYAVLWYSDTLQAYRKDRFEGFQQLPEGTGSWWNPYDFGPYGSLLSVRPHVPGAPSAGPAAPTAQAAGGGSASPATPAQPAGPNGGTDATLIVGILALVLVLAVGGVVVARRRASAEEED